jgi:hypothetical protein
VGIAARFPWLRPQNETEKKRTRKWKNENRKWKGINTEGTENAENTEKKNGELEVTCEEPDVKSAARGRESGLLLFVPDRESKFQKLVWRGV